MYFYCATHIVTLEVKLIVAAAASVVSSIQPDFVSDILVIHYFGKSRNVANYDCRCTLEVT
jgi:hypothetical protein